MADFITRGTQASLSSGGVAIPSTNLRQELVTDEAVARWVAEGRVWVSNNGTVDTPFTVTNAVTAIATPMWAAVIPSGAYIVPLFVEVNMITGTTAPTNITLVHYRNSIGAGTSTAGTDANHNTAFGGATSGLTIYKTYTAAGTAATDPVEFYRASFGLQAVATVGGLSRIEWSYKNHIAPRVGQSGALSTFQVGIGVAAAATAYITVMYAKFNIGDN